MTTQDPELSAALGWPGGISDPVLNRVQLLRMVAALRLASKQALEALDVASSCLDGYYIPRGMTTLPEIETAITALRAALAQEQAEPDLSRCPKCNGPADNGFDRSFPPNPYLCTKCMAEPGAWVASPDGRVIYDDISADDGLLRVSGDFENDEQRLRYAQRIADALNAALPKAEPVQEPVADGWRLREVLFDDGEPIAHREPPRRTMVPLTDEEIVEAVREADLDWQAGWTLDEHAPNRFDALARAVEKASWEKNK